MPTIIKRAGILIALAAVYLGAARLGLAFASQHPNVSPVWPPTGIALAAVLLGGYSIWPSILVGAFLANAMTGISLPTAGGIALGNTLQAISGAFLLHRFVKSRNPLDRAQDVFTFVIAGALSCIISATVGVTSLCLGGFELWSRYQSVWLTWWLGDTMGVLVVTPVLLAWFKEPRLIWRTRHVLEAVLFFVLMVTAAQIFFGDEFGIGTSHYPIGIIFFPFFIWAAFRFGQRGATTAILLASGLAVWGTVNGFGPFVRGTMNESLLLLQSYMAAGVVTILAMTAVLTERKHAELELRRAHDELEMRVKERTAALESANAVLVRQAQELERFAYISSHDLKEPLRMITSYLKLLAKRYQGKLDTDANEFIKYAVDGADRMAHLIHDLLEYSRIRGTEKKVGSVDCEVLWERMILNLKPAIEETGALLTHDPLPTVMGDATQLGQVFQNLLGNALKFRSRAVPRVHVMAERRGTEWIFSVRDNGIGIDGQYAERIFNVFQRLHPQAEYPGTGVGLAICKRIVEGHGGRIWVASVPGAGATFCFTLPTRES
jgi:signal transduction histidine kinase